MTNDTLFWGTLIGTAITAFVSLVGVIVNFIANRRKTDADAALSIANAAQVTAETTAAQINMLRLTHEHELDSIRKTQLERAERMAQMERDLEACKRRRATDDKNMRELLQYTRKVYEALPLEAKTRVGPPPDTDRLGLNKE